jgi:hypothetical protein
MLWQPGEMAKNLRKMARVGAALLGLVMATSCSGAQSGHGGSFACDYRNTSDLTRSATSLVIVTPVSRGMAESAGSGVPIASVQMEQEWGGVAPGSTFEVVNPDIGDSDGVSTMHVGKHYLAYLKPLVDLNGSQVNGVWLTVGGPIGIWRQTSKGDFEPLWNEWPMPTIGADGVAQMPRPAKTVAQVVANPTSCS